uniref:Uncharacterized protein n=1 Tax=Panagrolaimus sp. JU765 TaxID=591449 RepID=A0AC34RBU0_9BILA
MFLGVALDDYIGEIAVDLPLKNISEPQIWDLNNLTFTKLFIQKTETFFDYVHSTLYWFGGRDHLNNKFWTGQVTFYSSVIQNNLPITTVIKKEQFEILPLFLNNMNFVRMLKGDTVHGRIYMMASFLP